MTEDERDELLIRLDERTAALVKSFGAHVKHRVEWTDSTCETIWLAVHY